MPGESQVQWEAGVAVTLTKARGAGGVMYLEGDWQRGEERHPEGLTGLALSFCL